MALVRHIPFNMNGLRFFAVLKGECIWGRLSLRGGRSEVLFHAQRDRNHDPKTPILHRADSLTLYEFGVHRPHRLQ